MESAFTEVYRWKLTMFWKKPGIFSAVSGTEKSDPCHNAIISDRDR